MNDHIFTVCSDVHLTGKVPICREETSEEWIEVQTKFLEEFCQQHNPVIVGDICDIAKNNGSEFVNHFGKIMQGNNVVAVSGNHDTPLRNLSFIEYSDFATFHKMKAITSINYKYIRFGSHLCYGIPWCDEEDLVKRIKNIPKDISIVFIHRFVYDAKPYPTASNINSAEYTLNMFPDNIKLIICGDNHSKFIYRADGRTLLNCGTTFRDRADLISYQPSYYKIYDDLSIKEIPIDISNDKITDRHIRSATALEDIVIRTTQQGVGDITASFSENLKRNAKDKSCETYITKKYEEIINGRQA